MPAGFWPEPAQIAANPNQLILVLGRVFMQLAEANRNGLANNLAAGGGCGADWLELSLLAAAGSKEKAGDQEYNNQVTHKRVNDTWDGLTVKFSL